MMPAAAAAAAAAAAGAAAARTPVIVERMRLHSRLMLLPAVIVNAGTLSLLIHGSHGH
jgi:hypothetical protein